MRVLKILDEISVLTEKIAPKWLAQPYSKIVPASEEQITDFESKLGFALPEDYRAFLVKNYIRHNFEHNFECLDLDGVIRDWSMMTELLKKGTFDDGRIEHHETGGFGNWHGDIIKKVWWSPSWIPVSRDSCGNMKCLDLDPGRAGTRGQMTAMEVQDGQGPFATEYMSFLSYLETHRDYLRDGRFELFDHGIEIVD